MKNICMCWTLTLSAVFGLSSVALQAEPVVYEIDPSHTYPSFEADHMGGLSVWRGKINSSSGTVVLDKEAETGTLTVVMDMSTIDFGFGPMSEHAMTADMFDVSNYPTATYQGTLNSFADGAPTKISGELTMHGVTLPVDLSIDRFLCRAEDEKEVCGALATTSIDRSDFGVDFGAPLFDMNVLLRISIEAASSSM
ncbi:MAG: polyisoprenoid-binding protein [SAR86 cluster bacterium]|uniref:Polyisoprenoid-binding protein n=1 Tax=SAR86 cluster bacterium TaxID=2030880 RepID=A0A2A5CG87_9GAMM|nr:MAG: polyisoprenoid-binding protein [SAR86 cluster bacterium]